MNSIALPKFEGDFLNHLNNSSIPPIHKFGGSVFKTDRDILHTIETLDENKGAEGVYSAVSGISSSIWDMFVDLQGQPKDIFLSQSKKRLTELREVYQSIFKPLGVNTQEYWSDRLNFFNKIASETDLEDDQEYWKLQCWALIEFGEMATVHFVNECAIRQGAPMSIIDVRKAISLHQDFPRLSQDKFGFVDINLESSITCLARDLYTSERCDIVPGFGAGNGLIGWNGSDTTAALVARAVYSKTGVVPRVVFWKDSKFRNSTISGELSHPVEGLTKYQHMLKHQKAATQPFIHPQAIHLLDELSIPFQVRVPSMPMYRLYVTSCKKLREHLAANGRPSEEKREEVPQKAS